MFKTKGIFAIVGLITFFAILSVGFGVSHNLRTMGTILVGGIAFLLMTISMVLSTRFGWLEDWFGGLDRTYQVHKYSGLIAALTVAIHYLTVSEDELSLLLEGGVDALRPSAPVGMYAMILMLLGTVLAFSRKLLRYSQWRPTHKIMALVYVLAVVHIVTMPTEFFSLASPAGVLIALGGVAGLLSGVYAVFVMKRVTARSYVVEAVNRLERTTELVLKPKSQMLRFHPGQFAFIEVQGKGWNEPHPFTIASAPGENSLRFAVKALGDWTQKLHDELQPGSQVIVRGPYGRFDTSATDKKQVWIAGGIGVTPFLSKLRAMTPDDLWQIHFFYAVRSTKEALYLDELLQRVAVLRTVTMTVLNSEHNQRLSFETVQESLPENMRNYGFFMCGPRPMVSALSKALRGHGVRYRDIHAEAFEFR